MHLESGYFERAIQYLQSKGSLGIVENANQFTIVMGPCGDTMKISLAIEDERIREAKMQVLACPGAVGPGCAIVNLAKDKTLQQSQQLDLDALYQELEKLPDKKAHCARLAVKTLHKALHDYVGAKHSEVVDVRRGIEK